MKTLLIHALDPEAGILKQYFPQAFCKISEPGMELLGLSERYDILRTGIGLERTTAALKYITDPNYYDLLIQFGVSGSLSAELPVRSLINAHQFFALDQPPIKFSPVDHPALEEFNTINYFSSVEVVTDEVSRQVATSHGAQAVDMESYSAAEFCQIHDLPLLALRIISDRAGASTPSEFRKNFKVASEQLQNHILKHILKRKSF